VLFAASRAKVSGADKIVMSKGGPYGFQALAAEVTDYSKKTFDDAIRTWEQLMGRQIAGIGSRNPISIRQASLRQPHGRAVKAWTNVCQHGAQRDEIELAFIPTARDKLLACLSRVRLQRHP
jgi:hypothetical protein